MGDLILAALISAIAGIMGAIIKFTSDIYTIRLKSKTDLEVARLGAAEPGVETTPAEIPLEAPQPSLTDLVKQVNWVSLLGYSALIFVFFFIATWIITSRTPNQIASSTGVYLNDFEASQDQPWQIVTGLQGISRSSRIAYSGNYSLHLPVDLEYRPSYDDLNGTAIIVMQDRDVYNKLIIARIYLPATAPTNIVAGTYLKDVNFTWISGLYNTLKPGAWNTLTWHTSDAPSWQPPVKEFGLQFLLYPAVLSSDALKYEGDIYVDLLEIIEPSDIYPQLDDALQLFKSFDFDVYGVIPTEITIDNPNNTLGLSISKDAMHPPYGQRSLKLDLNLTPYDPSDESGYGGIRIDLDNPVLVEAVNSYLYIPERADISGADNFEAFYLAIDRNGDSIYRGASSIPVGQWFPLFWGTRFAFGESDICKDADLNDICDEKADFLWYSWNKPEITRLYIRILRHDEGYTGPAYLDDISVYTIPK